MLAKETDMDIYITPKEVIDTLERREAAERQMRVYGDSLKELQTILEPVMGSGSFLSRVVMDPPLPNNSMRVSE